VVAGPLRARPVYSSIIRAFGAKLILLFGSLALTFPIAEVGFRIFDYRGFHVDRERDWKEALVIQSELAVPNDLRWISRISGRTHVL
jgi:hypothetical protein